jgi:nucleoside-diphosphate-sugar epimerase
MKVFITGVGGWIGGRLGETLTDLGHQVVGIDRHFGNGQPHSPAATFVFGDVRDPAAWRDAMRGADVVVHSAAVHHVDRVSAQPAQAIDINVRGTRMVLEAAADARVRRFLFLSSGKVYGEGRGVPSRETDLVEPVEPYGLAKAVCEQYVRHFADTHGMETSVVRPFSVYGPGQDLDTGYIGALLRSAHRHSRTVLAGEPTHRRDFVHITDVIDALVTLVETVDPLPDILNAASGTSVALIDAVELIERVCATSIEAEYEQPRPGTITATHGDVTRLRELLRREPIDLDVGMMSTVDWFTARQTQRA